MADPAQTLRQAVQRGDSRALTGLFVACFALLLVVALCGQLLGRPWRTWLPGAESNRSLVGGVTASVYTFMSYLT